MKRSTLASVIGPALFGVMFGGCTLLQPPPAPSIFRQMDVNHDGKVTRAEFDAGFADAMLTVYSLGADGALTPAQWNDVERGGRGSSFGRLDTNHDGKLSRAELSAGKERAAVVNTLFNRIDKNHDGEISLDEGRPSGLDRTPQERAQGTGL